MKLKSVITGIVCGLSLVLQTRATERLFTYTYEPETLPKGAAEAEQSVTLRAGRNSAVGQEKFRRVQFREEIEYGVTDNYQLALYFNHQYESYKDPATGTTRTDYRQQGISIENKFMVWNPADHAVGLSLYLEPTYDGKNAELEQKIILGQRSGDWKWALNLTHATEWENDFRDKEGELEVSFGIARQLSPHWSVGVEIRDHNELPDYSRWENTAIYIGPVISCRHERWWATLSMMPQVYGANYGGDPDGNSSLELEGHEKINVRLLVGFSF
ncbi:MAG: hypothetical protein D4R57_00035 [Verrucomicrobiales bacterium]|nr:MAG: hypothetical protein D4R57_00035 [Verrucomicrobiales bacterium]